MMPAILPSCLVNDVNQKNLDQPDLLAVVEVNVEGAVWQRPELSSLALTQMHVQVADTLPLPCNGYVPLSAS